MRWGSTIEADIASRESSQEGPVLILSVNLRQTLALFGTVIPARIVRDLFGHSLGLGIAHLCWPIPKSILWLNVEQSLELKEARMTTCDPADPDLT